MNCEFRLKSMENLTRITVPTTFEPEPGPPPSPHFDDERTVLTARPVVPISPKLYLGNGRDYVLTAAVLLIAALLGAVAALSFDRFQKARQQEAGDYSQAAVTVNEPVAEMSEIPAATAPGVTTAVAPDTVEAITSPTPETRLTTPMQTPVPLSKAVKAKAKRSSVREDVGLQRPRRVEVQHEDAWTQRDANSVRAQRSRHAGRISEIFEGPGMP